MSPEPPRFRFFRIARKVTRWRDRLEDGRDLIFFHTRDDYGHNGTHTISYESFPRMGMRLRLATAEELAWMRRKVLAGEYVFGTRNAERSLHWIP